MKAKRKVKPADPAPKLTVHEHKEPGASTPGVFQVIAGGQSTFCGIDGVQEALDKAGAVAGDVFQVICSDGRAGLGKFKTPEERKAGGKTVHHHLSEPLGVKPEPAT